MYSLRREREPGHLTLELRLVLKEMSRNGIKRVLPSGSVPIQLILQLVK